MANLSSFSLSKKMPAPANLQRSSYILEKTQLLVDKHLCICLFVCLSLYLSLYLSIYLSTVSIYL